MYWHQEPENLVLLLALAVWQAPYSILTASATLAVPVHCHESGYIRTAILPVGHASGPASVWATTMYWQPTGLAPLAALAACH